MSDLREDPGCYQCGSFAGSTFRLCSACIQRNEDKRSRIRLRRRASTAPESSSKLRLRLDQLTVFGAVAAISGAAVAAYLCIMYALNA